MAKGRRTVSLQEKAEKAPVREKRAAAPAEPDALWSIAMLRIAMELKRADAPELEQIISGVVAKMGLPDREFRRFLSDRLALPR